MTTSSNIRAARMRAGLSQTDLARATGLTGGKLGRIERGERSLKPEDAIKIARACGVLVETLFEEPIAQQLRPSVGLPPLKLVGEFIITERVVRFVRTTTTMQRPGYLEGVENAYAMHVYTSEMEPRYAPGETVLVDPSRPVLKGQYAVVVYAPTDVADPRAYAPTDGADPRAIAEIRRVHGIDEFGVDLKRLDQPQLQHLVWSEIAALDLIVGSQI